MAFYIPGSMCVLGWHNLGLVNTGKFRLVWGNVGATPSIRCYGDPYGAYVKWSWAWGYGEYSCNQGVPDSHVVSSGQGNSGRLMVLEGNHEFDDEE